MSLRVVHAACKIERSNDLNESRLLLLLRAAGAGRGRTAAVDGIMKLAKMDFLLRYPEALGRALEVMAKDSPEARKAADAIPEEEKQTIEAKMIRFRYGPWDPLYRKWLSILAAKRLILIYSQGATIKVSLTTSGKDIADRLVAKPEFATLGARAKAVNLAIGRLTGTEAKNLIYQIVPELNGLKWGEEINL